MDIKSVLIGIGIFFLTLFVVIYGISVFYPSPDYDDYCGNFYKTPQTLPNKEVCPQVCVPLYEVDDGECVFDDCGSGCGADNMNTFETLEECQERLENLTCFDRYDDAREIRARNVFFIAIPVGVLIIALGAFLFKLESVGGGLMAGGVGTLIYGSGGYWQYAENLIKFLISLIGLVILIFVAYKFNRKVGKR